MANELLKFTPIERPPQEVKLSSVRGSAQIPMEKILQSGINGSVKARQIETATSAAVSEKIGSKGV